MDLQLNEKVAIVTGASKGIGLAVAERFVEEGARVVGASRAATPEIESLAEGGRLLHVASDLSEADAPVELVARAIEHFGGVDVLVNNVGGNPTGGPREGFVQTTDEDWTATFELNVLSAVRATRAALPALVERGGTVINVSSVNGRQPFPFVVDYAAAKAALTNLTKALSEEFAAQGVRVNVVSPGPVRTPWWTEEGGIADALAAQSGTDRDTVISTVVPEMMSLATGRMAEAAEVADVVALLASPRLENTTGAEFVVDSGFLKAT